MGNLGLSEGCFLRTKAVRRWVLGVSFVRLKSEFVYTGWEWLWVLFGGLLDGVMQLD